MTSNRRQRRLSPDEFSGPDRRCLDLLASVMNQAQSPALVGEVNAYRIKRNHERRKGLGRPKRSGEAGLYDQASGNEG